MLVKDMVKCHGKNQEVVFCLLDEDLIETLKNDEDYMAMNKADKKKAYLEFERAVSKYMDVSDLLADMAINAISDMKNRG